MTISNLIDLAKRKLGMKPSEYRYDPYEKQKQAAMRNVGSLRVSCVECDEWVNAEPEKKDFCRSCHRMLHSKNLYADICIFCEKPELGGK